MQITFHGAARQVTGSCHLFECAGDRVLVDCGMFQGGAEGRDNAAPFGFDPGTVDKVLLTHAHLDHCGRLPLLVKRGFHGEIVATAATRELARVVLMDAAKIQEEDARRQNRQRERQGRKRVQPLYEQVDALDAMDHFGRTASYGKQIELSDHLKVTFEDAGHILGSSYLVLQAHEDDRWRKVLFSGDLGNQGKPIVRDTTPPSQVDTLVVESTYGDRNHRSIEASVEELYDAINATLDRGGNALIPSFALERSQDLLYFLREGIEQGALPHDLPVFLDSPMAILATEIFQRHPECYDQETRDQLERVGDPFGLPNLNLTRDPRDSMEINNIRGGAVIIAGSGMCTGGRILHHLKHNLWREQASVIFVSFAVPGTLARRIIDGAEEVQVMGETLPVNARVHTINGFSAHADREELLAFQRQADPILETLLVHGEVNVMQKLANQLEAEGSKVRMPEHGQTVPIGDDQG